MSHADFMKEMEEAEDLGSLPYWAPTEKTPTLIGTVLEYRATETQYGPMHGAALRLLAPAPVIEGKGKPRLASVGEAMIVWLKATALKSAWAQWAPAPGEVVGVKRTGERHGSRGTYQTYVVRVEGRSPALPGFLAQPAPVPAPEPESAPEPVPGGSYGDPLYEDDDLPF